MPTAQGRARREGEALARIQEAQGIITDALGFTLTRLPDEKTRDTEMRRVLMLEQWAHWLGQIAAALTNAPAQEVITVRMPDDYIPIMGDEPVNLLNQDGSIPVEFAPVQYQGDGIPPITTKLMIQGRYWDALHKAGIHTIADIPGSDDDLLAIPGIGPAAVQEIREAQKRLTDDQTN